MSQKTILHNVVQENDMREIQKRTLEILNASLTKSFGPMGSNTTIIEASGSDVMVKYTKDGHTIVKAIQFQDVIESAVKDDIYNITNNIVNKVGDGTTSAVILSANIFEELCKLTTKSTPYGIIRKFKQTVEDIKQDILEQKQEFTSESAFDISYISTNGNTEVAQNISDIYKKHGNEVYIHVGISPNEDSQLKIYDGLTLETGYADVAFVNTKGNLARLKNPRIYAFEDVIDTPEMGGFVDAIISRNILEPIQSKQGEVYPTVIMAPKLSRDYSAYMDSLIKGMNNTDLATKIPLLVVTNIMDQNRYHDMIQLIGATPIRKYIHKEMQELDIKNGLAPTIENIHTFYGTAELVESDSFKTKLINPKEMFKEGTREYSDTFNRLVSFLEAELEKATNESKDLTLRHMLRKRLQSLKSNMVEYLVGGITIADRDALKDLVEDAVKNCRSAAQHGVGFAANYEGLRASAKFADDSMGDIIHKAYRNTIKELYNTANIIDETAEDVLNTSIKLNSPYDIKAREYSTKLLSSIQSDIVILDSIAKIMTLMITTNQVICPDFRFNKYSLNK